jgi:hypothetical protein
VRLVSLFCRYRCCIYCLPAKASLGATPKSSSPTKKSHWEWDTGWSWLMLCRLVCTVCLMDLLILALGSRLRRFLPSDVVLLLRSSSSRRCMASFTMLESATIVVMPVMLLSLIMMASIRVCWTSCYSKLSQLSWRCFTRSCRSW